MLEKKMMMMIATHCHRLPRATINFKENDNDHELCSWLSIPWRQYLRWKKDIAL